MSVYQKLMQARVQLQNKELKKSGQNKFAGYSYFELGDFIPTVQKIFADLGLCGVVSYGTDIAKLVITDTESGGYVEITSPMSTAALKGCHEVQNLGAVQTYIRRYLWVTAMEIVEHDAVDASMPDNTIQYSSEDVYATLNKAASKGNASLDKAIGKTPKEALATLTNDQKKALRSAASLIDAEIAVQA